MIRRRYVLTLLGGAAVAWPVVARAQQTAMPVIGYLSGRSPEAETTWRMPFLKGLQEAGFVTGQNCEIEYRYSQGRDSELPLLASDLVGHQVAVLVTTSRPAALAAKSATAKIPIVFTSGVDPVKIGLVANFNSPGGNVTGVSLFTSELGSKRLGLLRELLSKPGLIAFVVDPSNGSTPLQVKQMQAAANALSQPLTVLSATTENEIDAAFAAMAQQGVSAVLYGSSLFFQTINSRLVSFAARQKIPAVYEWREFAAVGGLMSYSTSPTESGHQIGIYVGQILKGAKPADLPVVQASRFELVINLKTAKALGIAVPPTLLARADEVIE